MSSEESSGSENRRRARRRRYFRRKRSTGQQAGADETTQGDRDQKGESRQSRNKGKRGQRSQRRRRERTRRSDGEARGSVSIVDEIEIDYVKPESIFVYTCVLRPDSRDAYEYHSEHFGHAGRRLEDFQIDLSSLFPDEGTTEEAESAAGDDLTDDETGEGS